MALLEQQPPEKKGPSLVVQLAMLLVMSALAAGAAWFAGGYLQSRSGGPEEAAAAATETTVAEHAGEEDVAAHTQPGIFMMEPITTNLAEPSEIWVRAELSLVFEGEPDPVVAAAIHQDLFAYLRTVKLRQVETASGLQHLRSDLAERASIRSEGAVKQILFRALLFE
ncbi:flagellar basal body-associated FliL family protein [Nitratireductor sp. L1-7-SE]|uniref:Flagellar protein FliL n=1 Tax=Nitratireductor rhodophyticola TaxID=2854036 RepID=A0ABS7RBD5_9HYPH|nr:flagellar basal body-associated FliL family protein [Nitratireductor rhodophyticola]MBY8917665.1 flagellar basal body-associated FliL family protein [Nitratireductor rhodophyticola]MBY8922376.1 flagellar basal body-associated FliL family protein [Nitratireductor rhodophyticola]